MFRQFTRMMELHLIEDYKNCFPLLQGSELTDALIMECVESAGISGGEVLRTEKGKPYVTVGSTGEEEIFVSVSHSGNYFVCLVADVPVGVDVQYARSVKMRQISTRYFTENEQQYVEHRGEKGFYELWTRKEAYSKYTGTGLEEILKRTEVLERDDVAFLDFQLEEGVYCSCCIKK